MVTYVLSLVFTLKTHKHLYAGGHGDDADDAIGTEGWSIGKAIAVLLVATAFVAVMSEFLVGAVEATAKTWGMTEVFVGVILVAIIGNAAEHSTAILMALKNKMDIAINIAVGSSIQIALFVAPAAGLPELRHRPAADGPDLHQLRGGRDRALGRHHPPSRRTASRTGWRASSCSPSTSFSAWRSSFCRHKPTGSDAAQSTVTAAFRIARAALHFRLG